jgi:hypothetical protein
MNPDDRIELRRRCIVADVMSRCAVIHSRLLLNPANRTLPISADTVAAMCPGLFDLHGDIAGLPSESPPEGVDRESWREHRRRVVSEWFGSVRADAVTNARRIIGIPPDGARPQYVQGIAVIAAEIVTMCAELDRIETPKPTEIES